jgi:hypothetical protein
VRRLTLVLAFSSAAFAQYPNGYSYRRVLTVQAGQIAGAQTGFTIVDSNTYADLATVANGGKVQHTCTQDLYGITIPADWILTSDPNGLNKLAGWKFDTYNPATGAHSWHAMAPANFTAGSVVYEFFGNSGVTTCQGGSAASVWDSSTVLAQVFPNGVSLDVSDYLGSAPTNHGATAALQLNSGAASFDASNTQYIDDGNGAALNITGALTVEAWANHMAGHHCTGGHRILSKLEGSPNYNGYELLWGEYDGSSCNAAFQVGNNGASAISLVTSVAHLADSTLYQLAGAYDGTNPGVIYVNGTAVPSTYTGHAWGAGAIGVSARNVNVGRWPNTGSGSNYFPGTISEVVVSNVARGSNWVQARFNNLSAPDSFWSRTGTQIGYTAFTVSPAVIPSGHSGNITLTLSGSGTEWTGSTVFTVSGVANVTKVSQTIVSGTSATIVVNSGAGTGALTVAETVTGSTAAITLAVPALAINLARGNLQSIQALTLTGTNTVWTQEALAGLFTVSGGAGASIAAPTITGDGAATVNLTVGTQAGVLTITDTSTGVTATFVAGAMGTGTCAVAWGQ